MQKSVHIYFIALSVVIAMIFWGLSSLSHGPEPRPADIAPDQFSAMRAFDDLTDLINGGAPHPSGSAENLRIRKHIERKFIALGYTPQIQKSLACTLHYPGCTRVENIIVRVRGTGSGDAILLTAHYDSVPAGPAAADDGSGTVAMLEIARNIKAMPAFKNDLIFLITDGEEGGLRGARAFADEHPLMRAVKLVINLEARGASGPSTMFETSNQNARLIKAFAKTNPHPVANSLSYEIYKRLPNDTDYSIYKPLGVAGLNFAFTGDVALYHSLRDDLEHLDKASLQHQGDNMLAAVRAFGNADIGALIGPSDATYIDLFGKTLLRWPSPANLPLAIVSLAVLVFALVRGGQCPIKALKALSVAVFLCALTPAIGFVLSFPLGRWPDLFYLDHPYPWPGRLALVFGAGFASWLSVKLFYKHLGYNPLVWAGGLVFTLSALVLSLTMSGASYLMLLPTLAIAIGIIIDITRKHDKWWVAAHLGFVVCAYMAIYHFIALEVILHYNVSHLRIAPLVILGLALLPLFLYMHSIRPYKLYGVGLAVLSAAFAIISWQSPGFNTEHPRGQNFVYAEGYAGEEAVWISEVVDRQDPVFMAESGFSIPERPPTLWRAVGRHIALKPTQPIGYAKPVIRIVSDSVQNGTRTVEFKTASAHKGFEMAIAFQRENAPTKVWIDEKPAADYTEKPYRRPLTIRGPGKHIYHVKMNIPEGEFKMALIDTFTLGEARLGGLAVQRLENAAPLHSGDRALVYKLITLK